MSSSARSVPLEIMFMPMASPVWVANRTKSVRPAMAGLSESRRAKREVELKAALRVIDPSSDSIQPLAAAHMVMDGNSSAGPRVIASACNTVVTPPPAFNALQPREVEATSAPSVVAMGIGNASPSIRNGPAMPTGRGT